MYDQMYKKARHQNTKRSFLPPALIDQFNTLAKRMSGLSLIIAAISLLGALVSYSAQDPSWNCATTRIPHNLLGEKGAFIADLLFQLFGYSSYLLVLFINNLGVSTLKYASFPIRIRHIITLFLAIFGICFLSSHLMAILNGSFLPGGIVGHTSQFFIKKLCTPIAKVKGYEIVSILIAIISITSLIHAMRWNYNKFQATWRTLKTLFSILTSILRLGYRLIDYIKSWHTTFSHSPNEITLPPFDHPIAEPEHNDLSANFIKIARADTIVDDYADEETNSLKTTPTLESKKTTPIPTPKPKPRDYIFDEGNHDYQHPSIELLDKPQPSKHKGVTSEVLQEQAQLLKEVLAEFGVKGTIEAVCPGPVVTLFEFTPAPGIKISRVIGLADDIARSMSALSTRIAVIPGKTVIGIELPNQKREIVYLRDVLESKEYQQTPAALPLILGKNIGGLPIISDLSKMPHLLVAGTTGSGKSVAINTMILSLLYRLTPDQCKFIMIDPKMLELSVYDNIPHLLSPVVTDPKQAVVALKWTVREMEDRYRAMSKLGVRNIDGFNARLKEARRTGEILMRRVQTGFDPDSGKPIYENQPLNFDILPYIVVVVDEMADLMLVAGKEIESTVQRLAQMARAAGIHLIMATQRPSVDVITGTIKANFPTRISFQVTSKIDSRTILGEQGAEQLLGQGDMLFMAGGGRISRVHGPYVRDDEVEHIVSFLKTQGAPSYIETITQDDEMSFDEEENDSGSARGDEFYDKAVDLVLSEGKASTSFVQRHLQIGYNRAARIIEQMEKEGIITPANRVGKREVIGRAG